MEILNHRQSVGIKDYGSILPLDRTEHTTALEFNISHRLYDTYSVQIYPVVFLRWFPDGVVVAAVVVVVVVVAVVVVFVVAAAVVVVVGVVPTAVAAAFVVWPVVGFAASVFPNEHYIYSSVPV